MATFYFLLRGKQNNKNIYVRYKDSDRFDTFISTKLKVDESHWSKSFKRIKPTANFEGKEELILELEEIENNLKKVERYTKSKEYELNKALIQSAIKGDLGELKSESMSIVQALEKYKQHLISENEIGSRKISKGAIRNYNTTKSRLEKFEKSTHLSTRLDRLNFKFKEAYANFARRKLKLAPNSIAKDFKQIKTVSNYHKDLGYEIHPHVFSRKFRFETESTSFVTLTEQEIEDLLEFNGSNYLTNARDWLIIGCCTGCRVGDLMKLSVSNISFNKKYGIDVITYTQNKTGRKIVMPVHKHIKKILSRNNDQFPHAISAEKFNEYIKILCKKMNFNQEVEGSKRNEETGIWEKGHYEKWELIKSHICRRSFATNNYGKLSNKFIMAVTGHKSETMFLQYVGAVEDDHLGEIAEIWNK